ncbi:CDI toxin immunity protein [Peribacillus deserti]|uniref:Uncharacterized protein n=1 Tax=Peribacillus deserti TaxID=673318 RepID=A0A2N5M685_9BACI|nr:hypothetical protein [Peribacillus deserti]PLT29855.1 hypothetical protein CUU66_11185 [Peribacillus deserti]
MGESSIEREERKKRLEELLRERKKKEEKIESERRIADMLELFPDKDKVEILCEKESNKVETKLTDSFPIAWYGRIDWGKLNNKIVIPNEEIQNIPYILLQQGLENISPVYLIVGLYGYPVVKTSISTILDNIEEIMCMGPDQYIYCPLSKYVIEFFHDDVITVGWL